MAEADGAEGGEELGGHVGSRLAGCSAVALRETSALGQNNQKRNALVTAHTITDLNYLKRPTRHALLSNEQILQALSESYNVVAAITKYQVFLTSGIGLPKDDAGRIELMAAGVTVLEKIRTEIRALENELNRREDQEKRRF